MQKFKKYIANRTAAHVEFGGLRIETVEKSVFQKLLGLQSHFTFKKKTQ